MLRMSSASSVGSRRVEARVMVLRGKSDEAEESSVHVALLTPATAASGAAPCTRMTTRTGGPIERPTTFPARTGECILAALAL